MVKRKDIRKGRGKGVSLEERVKGSNRPVISESPQHNETAVFYSLSVAEYYFEDVVGSRLEEAYSWGSLTAVIYRKPYDGTTDTRDIPVTTEEAIEAYLKKNQNCKLYL